MGRRFDAEHAGSKEPSVSGYIYWGCRCIGCRKAWNAYHRLKRIERTSRGLCRNCKEKLAPHSKEFCPRHLKEHGIYQLARYHAERRKHST